MLIIKIEIVLFIDTKTELISHSTNALRVEWLSNINLKNPLPIVLFILAHTFLWNLRHVWIAICQRFLIFVSTQWFCIQNRLNWNDNFKLTELWGLQSQSIYSNIPPTLLIILRRFASKILKITRNQFFNFNFLTYLKKIILNFSRSQTSWTRCIRSTKDCCSSLFSRPSSAFKSCLQVHHT